MTQKQIRDKREKLREELTDLDEQQEALFGRLKAIQRRCKHPKLRSYYAMGEEGMICDDCGYQT